MREIEDGTLTERRYGDTEQNETMARLDPTPLTLAETADRLGVHYMTAYKYVRAGRLAAEKVGKNWLVQPDDLAAFEHELAGPARRGSRRASYPSELQQCLIQGDEAGAWGVLEQGLTAGMAPEAVLVDLVGSAMTAVGDDWSTGAITVAQEHQASTIAMRLVGRLGPQFARRGPKRGRVVIGAAPFDEHALPTAILRDLLRGRGLAVTDLGANVPPESWTDTVREAMHAAPRLVSVGVCHTTPGNEAAVAEAIAAIRAVTAVPIVLGGYSVTSRAEAAALGADAYSRSAWEAAEMLDPRVAVSAS